MKRQLAALLLTIFALSLTACGETAAESETRTVYAMDTVMNLTVYGENAAAALESAQKKSTPAGAPFLHSPKSRTTLSQRSWSVS